METANQYEKTWWGNGKRRIVGIDEAGRGPIAGPRVVAGVIFPVGYHHEAIYDSKKVSEKKREALYEVILHDALAYHIEIVDPETIDRKNIYRATQDAMQHITEILACDGVLTDAMPLPACEKDVLAIVKGDQQSVSIAAASILAKVTRDRIMYAYDEQYPQYGFAKHKGYPTKAHLEALRQYGVLDFYRHSYGPVAKMDQLQMDLAFDD